MVTSLIRPSYRQGFYSPQRGGIALNPNLWKGLTGLWSPRLGNQGGIVRDQTGRGNPITLQGATWGIGERGYQLQFDRTASQYAEISTANYDDNLFNQQEYSLSIWAEITEVSTSAAIFIFGLVPRSVAQEERSLFLNNGLLGITNFPRDSGSSLSDTEPARDNWHHIVVTDKVNIDRRVYVDGVLFASDGGSVYTGEVPTAIDIMTWQQQGRYISGNIGTIALYNLILTPNQVSQLFVDELAHFSTRRIIGRAPVVGGVTGDIAFDLPILEVQGLGGATASLTLPIFTTEFAGHLPSDINITLPVLTVQGGSGATAEITLPIFTTEFAGHLAVTASLSFPVLLVQGGSGATGSITLPLLNVVASSGIITNVAITLPQFTTSFAGHLQVDGSVTLPIFTVNATASGENQVILTFPLLSVQALGAASAEITLPSLSLTVVAHLPVDGTITLPLLSLSAFSSPGIVDITLPIITVNVVSGLPGVDITLPILTLSARAYRGTPPECVVMNTKISAVSEYNDYAFNSYARFNGVDLAANQNGIYAQDTTSLDDSVYKIKAHIKSGIIDIHSDTVNRLRDSYIVYKSDGDIRLTSTADKKATRRYLVSEQTDGINKSIKNRRIKFERGIRNRYFDFKIENINGSEFELELLRVFTEPIISKRR